MSGLEAFGLACNVMQTIGFAIEMASVCRTIFRTGSPDPSTATLLDHSTQITTSLKNSISSARPVTRDVKELLDIANKCLDAISTLKAEVDKLTRPSAKGKVFASLRLGVRSKFKEGEINKLEKRMRDYQKVLESGFLLRVCNQNDALQLKLETGFRQLDSSIQCFIEAISRGQTNLQDLLMSHKDSIVEVVKAESTAQNAATSAVTSEVKKTQEMIKEASLDALMWEKRQRLLKSLKYDTMNERFGQVKAAFEGTCGWMIQGVQSAPNGTHGEPDGENLPPVCPHRKKKLSWSCFPCWLESPQHKIYWVQGKAGSGKSTLMKFLVTNPALWYPQSPDSGQDPLILSHFLWAAGSPRQKSLRGILLNLLYQLLSDDQHVLDHVINTFPGLSLKDVEGDWTLEELEGTMVASLKAIATRPKVIATRPKVIATRPKAIATRPVFIFLDGLDEFGSSDASVATDPRTLLDLATRLSTLDNVKTCISSRPEPVFKTKLGGLCSLRLQDLTRSDMEKYAKAELLSNEIIGLENQKEYQYLVDRLCDMSDGVFLWTALAVRSLSKGLTNEDDISELYARLEKMPTGLYALYKDMWSRLNEDQDLYKKEAAQYFHLVIHWRSMPSHRFAERCTTFHLLAALNPSISRAYLENDKASFPSDLEARCEKLGKRVETRSAGLLEYGDQGSIDFIHRSALEFLTDTPEGQQIMAHDLSTANDLRLWLLQADVARAYLVLTKALEYPAAFMPDDANVYDLVLDIQKNWDDSALPGDVQIMLLEACKRMAEVQQFSLIGSSPWDFAGSLAANGYHNVAIPFVRYPQFSPYVNVIRSRYYRIYLFILASATPWGCFPHDELWLGKAKVVETILAEYPLLEFPDPVSSATVESCFSDGNMKTLAAKERTEVLVLLAALTFPMGIDEMKLFKQLEVFFKPRIFVENFFQRYPHNKEKILLQLSWAGSMFEEHGSNCDRWWIHLALLGPDFLDYSWRDGDVTQSWRGVDVTRWVVIECDTTYAAELLTLGRARQGKGTGENKADTVTDKNEIWRRAAGSNKADPKILAFGGRALTDLDGMSLEQFIEFNYSVRIRESGGKVLNNTHGTPANCGDANRVLSNLSKICSTEDARGFFLIPGLTESLRDIKKRQTPIDSDGVRELVKANSFDRFAREFMGSFKRLTSSPEYLSRLAEDKK